MTLKYNEEFPTKLKQCSVTKTQIPIARENAFLWSSCA